MHPLHKHIEHIVGLTNEEFDRILAAFKIKRLIKGQFLLSEGEVCTTDCFVLSGSLIQYFNDKKGKMHLVQFAFADWWIADWRSITHKTPSIYNICSLEDSVVLLIRYDQLNELFRVEPKLDKYFRVIFQNAFAAQQQRIGWLQLTARDRYREFLITYPGVEQKLSQSHIAAFLGITRESLSRLKGIDARTGKADS